MKIIKSNYPRECRIGILEIVAERDRLLKKRVLGEADKKILALCNVATKYYNRDKNTRSRVQRIKSTQSIIQLPVVSPKILDGMLNELAILEAKLLNQTKN